MRKEKHPKQQWKEDLLFLLLKIGILTILAVVLFGFVFGVHRCGDHAMHPAVKNGDLVFYYRLQKEYQNSDVVVLKKGEETQVRRIIAKAGDEIDITEEGLKINGYLHQEKDIYSETVPYVEGITFPVTLKEGEYFVLGDDRSNAKDSRMYGAIKQEEIKGIVMTILRRRSF